MNHTASRPLRITLVDDSELAVAGLTTLLAPFAERVVLVDSRTAVARPAELDVVLFDPTSLGSMAQAMLRDLIQHGGAEVAVFTWSPDVDATGLGEGLSTTAPVLSKSMTGSQIVRSVEEIAEGRFRPSARPATPAVVSTVEATASSPVIPLRQATAGGLTPREESIIRLIVAGHSNQEIAEELVLSINSIKTYIRLAYRKMGVERRTQAVLWGLEHGLDAVAVDSGATTADAGRALVG